MYNLHGYKWFSSATDSDITFTLARTEENRRLSMFYLRTRNDSGKLNNIQARNYPYILTRLPALTRYNCNITTPLLQVYKLKNKLGTRQLPTAELLLDGTESLMESEEGRGVSAISNMLTVTRIHNSVSAAAAMRKITSLARDYATRRSAFGSEIHRHPLHIQTLARMEVETRGCCAFFLDLGTSFILFLYCTVHQTEVYLMKILISSEAWEG